MNSGMALADVGAQAGGTMQGATGVNPYSTPYLHRQRGP